MLLGYNTNGLAHHRLSDALTLLADKGYQCVALTLDVGLLDPYQDPAHLREQIEQARRLLGELGLACVIETGARYLLNPRKKHDPTLMDPDPDRRALRVDFLERAISIGKALEARAVSFWSGALPDAVGEEEAMERLAGALQPVLRHAESHEVQLGFEPEPGMFIDTMARFAQLDERVQHSLFDLTLDIGHLHCLEPVAPSASIRAWGSRIVNVHIEDMNRGVHEHLRFGEGSIDFPPVLDALREVRYQGPLNVELSRHSHMAVEAVRESAAFLAPWLGSGVQ